MPRANVTPPFPGVEVSDSIITPNILYKTLAAAAYCRTPFYLVRAAVPTRLSFSLAPEVSYIDNERASKPSGAKRGVAFCMGSVIRDFRFFFGRGLL